MPAFVTPTLFDSSRSFRRLRSFHLSPLDIGAASKHDTLPETSPKKLLTPAPRNVTNPLRGSSITTLVVIVSLIFIFTISFSFVGADVDEEYFGLFLKRVAETSPGIVLLGENVDVDVDEPSVTVRWSILACGEDFVLPGSGVYGSNVCGLPAQPFYIFVDSDQTPTATYDPSQIPFSRDSGYRRNIPNLFQFDSDHVLDVHEARLYPFDTYMLSSTIRAFSFDNVSLPIRGAATIGTTSSFNIETVDVDSYSTSNNTQSSSRDVDMRISRPGAIRVIILLLFGISWILAHLSIVLAIVARKITEVKPMIKYLVFAGAIFLILPQLRNSMPDAPGLDGVLIDSIGFFPQVVITAISTLTILLCLIGRELDDIKRSQENILPILSPPPSPPPSATSRPRPPPIPTPISSPMEKSHYDKYRLVQHLQGHYVFPPIQTTHRILPSVDYQSSTHRKSKTMSRIRETSEESFFVE